MELSCAFPPMPDTPAHIALAERLGYRRAWVFDTPALQLDVWMTLALAAAGTSRIGLGPGVLIPSLRHPMVTAAAIAHLVELAPDRVEIGIGAGFTGRNALGQRALRWSEVAHYTETVQTLLRGETAVLDGAAVAMLHWPGQAPTRPVSVPWRFAVAGPKGLATARELNGGIFTSRPPIGAKFEGYGAVTAMVSGTVLDPDEPVLSERVLAAAGPGVAVRYHLAFESGKVDALRVLPNGERFGALIAALPASQRHLRLHQGHLSQLNELDRQVLDADALRLSPLLCEAAAVPGWVERYADMGVTELAFEPMGDIPGELERFARAASLV